MAIQNIIRKAEQEFPPSIKEELDPLATQLSGYVDANFYLNSNPSGFTPRNSLNQSYRNVYISNAIGNNLDAQIGNINRPYQTAQSAWDAIRSTLPSASYILNFYGSGSSITAYTINVDNVSWPSNVGIRGIGPGPISLTLTHRFDQPQNFNITDWGYQSIQLSITSQGKSYAGGLPSNGGNGGNITLKNCFIGSIITRGGSASPSNLFGQFGAVDLENCKGGTVSLEIEDGGIGPIFDFVKTQRFVNSNILFSSNSNANLIRTIFNIENSKLETSSPLLFPNSSSDKNYINSIIGTNNIFFPRKYYFDTQILSGNRVIKNLELSNTAILSGNLTGVVLHDNITGRSRANYQERAMVVDFASGIYLYPFVESPNLVYNTGDQTISGVKSFVSRPTVNGTGVLLSGEISNLYTNDNPSGFITNQNVVFTTGTQTISGDKTFQADQYNFDGASISIYGGGSFEVNASVETKGIPKDLGGVSGIQVMTTGAYNSGIPLSGVVYILI
jgi:hypothetical protein